jgi:hypothetical protein
MYREPLIVRVSSALDLVLRQVREERRRSTIPTARLTGAAGKGRRHVEVEAGEVRLSP